MKILNFIIIFAFSLNISAFNSNCGPIEVDAHCKAEKSQIENSCHSDTESSHESDHQDCDCGCHMNSHSHIVLSLRPFTSLDIEVDKSDLNFQTLNFLTNDFIYKVIRPPIS